MDAVYREDAPEVADQPGRPVGTRYPDLFRPDEHRGSPWFADVDLVDAHGGGVEQRVTTQLWRAEATTADRRG
jgi:hypothetical protein